MRYGTFVLSFALASGAALAQDAVSAPQPASFVIQAGTRIPLSMINSVNTKNSASGDRIYLQTVFPILANGKIVIPPGSYVEGTVTEVKRPGRVKGRGSLFVRFDSLILPNGTTREFHSRLGSLDGRGDEKLERKEGRIESESGKGNDAKTIAITGASGGLIGAGLGSEVGSMGEGAAIGAGAGVAAGVMMSLLSRGPEATLPKGSTIEMVLDRQLSFKSEEIDFRSNSQPVNFTDGTGPSPAQNNGTLIPGVHRLPI
jgi:type IV secretion system protein VirB10